MKRSPQRPPLGSARGGPARPGRGDPEPVEGPPEIWDANVCFGTLPFKDVDCSLATTLDMLARGGITRAAACSLKGVYYDFHEGNEETFAAANLAAPMPQPRDTRARAPLPRLLPVATIDPRRMIGCVEEVALRARQGCRALRFFPDIQGWPVNFLPLRPILEQAQELGLAVMLPAGLPGLATQAVEALRGFDVPLILMGAGYGVMAEAIAAAGAPVAARARDNTYIETHRLVTPDGIDIAAQAVGHQRLVFGSGAAEVYPGSALAVLERSKLSPQQRRDVLCDNLRRALRL